MKTEYKQIGESFIIENGETRLSFNNFDSAMDFVTGINSGKLEYKNLEIKANGTTLDYDAFLLKIHNKGEYDKAYKDVDGEWKNLNDYDSFITKETLIKSGINFIEELNSNVADFENSYKRAYKIKTEIEALFNKRIDVFVYENQSYTLKPKFLENITRYYRCNEARALNAKYSEGMKKGTRQGAEKAKSMQQAILVRSGN